MDDQVPPVAWREPRLYPIGTVTQRTGITEATLRVWERRYHFPQTVRSAGGHRLYPEREVLRLLWVRMRQQDGVRAGSAIRALDQANRAAMVAEALAAPPPAAEEPAAALTAWQSPLLEALRVCDAERAVQALQSATAEHTPEDVVTGVIGPVLAAIGEAWSEGRVDVATEHFASNLLRHSLLQWMRDAEPPFQVRPIVLACAPEELHEGGLLMLGVLLRRLGWPLVYLGQSLPLGDLEGLVARVRPALIVFAAMSEPAALALATWPQWLARASGPDLPLVGYGGRAFVQNPALSHRVPGAWLGDTIIAGCQRINRLMLHLCVLRS